MFAPANQTHFALTIEGLDNDLQVLALQGREAISQPFVFEVGDDQTVFPKLAPVAYQ